MANNHSLQVYIEESGSIDTEYGLKVVNLENLNGSPKVVTRRLFDISDPSNPRIVYAESPTTKWFTAIINTANESTIVIDDFNYVNSLLIQNCEICKTPEFPTGIVFYSDIGTNDLQPLGVPAEYGKIYINVDTGVIQKGSNNGLAPYYDQLGNNDIVFDFMGGLLTTTIYAPNTMRIHSIINVKNTPTTTITKNGSAYTLDSSIAIGDTLVVTVSTASVIKLNIIYV